MQNCNVNNDGAFDAYRGPRRPDQTRAPGSPVRFGAEGERGVVATAVTDQIEIVDVSETSGEDGLLVHDEHHRPAEPGIRALRG